jgi:host factor-I protein
MSDGTDSNAAARTVESEDFGNRKLIRPSLHREPARGAERSFPGSRKTPPAEQTHAENFYYQKQIQSKTPMVVVTRDGEQLRGIIEWYDKSCIKLNRGSGQSNLLVYKTAIRYMYKEGEEPR